jgi:methionyl-tRNA synthetase
VVSVALNLCYLLSALLEPFIPSTAADILQILRLPPRTIPHSFSLQIRPNHQLGRPFHLFTKLDDASVAQLKAKFAGKSSSGTGVVSVSESAAQ